MKNFTDTGTISNVPRWLRVLARVWRWLTEPHPSITEPERRLQARLLMAMLLVLMSLGLISLILSLLGFYSTVEDSIGTERANRWITFAAVIILTVEYGLSRTMHFLWAAGMAVATVLGAIFVIVILRPADVQYVFFLVLGGLIASLFLSTRATAIVFIITFAVSLLLPVFVPGYARSNNIYAGFFIGTIGGLVVLAASLRQRYLEKIERQTRQLVESEARLRELSTLDSLTGLNNRRFLEEMFPIEIKKAMRKEYPIGVIMADIDHFKRINDLHGHAAGDSVLILVGSFLRTQVRSSDIACRYGGEEFVLILPEASREISRMRAERIRKTIRQFHVEHDGQTLEPVTLSLGVASLPAHGSTVDEILKAADAALYRAKDGGRDCTVVAE